MWGADGQSLYVGNADGTLTDYIVDKNVIS